MIKGLTKRGFVIFEFTDLYGEQCSLQESSLADKDAIWLGITDPEPKILASETLGGGIGWVKYPMPKGVLTPSRMHLNRKTARELAELLLKFADTGEI